MGHQHDRACRLETRDPAMQRFRLRSAILRPAEEGVEQRLFAHRSEVKPGRSIQAPAPLAGKHIRPDDAVLAKHAPDAAGLSASLPREIALRGAIPKLEASGSPVPGAIAWRISTIARPARASPQRSGAAKALVARPARDSERNSRLSIAVSRSVQPDIDRLRAARDGSSSSAGHIPGSILLPARYSLLAPPHAAANFTSLIAS